MKNEVQPINDRQQSNQIKRMSLNAAAEYNNTNSAESATRRSLDKIISNHKVRNVMERLAQV
ncbi:hypothetical protein [Leuconostoc lactis]|uniref:hypothetical protein n=1 Tax=Leuconostoc lactis TaxID=1246 RepID=UPI0021A6675D|nr:hypothetical protein [Leuconostoc lactis]MCT3115542.1 hypothetical protein [Leuconostoc lactis]